MIITCPDCATRFLLDDSLMPVRGRKVRCARCGNVWLEQSPLQLAEAVTPVDPVSASIDTEPEPVVEQKLDADIPPYRELAIEPVLEAEPEQEQSIDNAEGEEKPAEPPASPTLEATLSSGNSAENTPPTETEKKSSAVIWILIILVLVGAAIGTFAYLKPNEFQHLIGNGKPPKPAVVATPEGWGRVTPPTTRQPVLEEPTPEELVPEEPALEEPMPVEQVLPAID
jgi:predicted Zn finger-like uncharacterized protein